MVDSALSASRHRIVEIQKAHNHLLKRYTALENAYLDLKEYLEENEKGDEALLSGYRSASPSPTSTHSNVMYRRRAHANSNPDVYQPGPRASFPFGLHAWIPLVTRAPLLQTTFNTIVYALDLALPYITNTRIRPRNVLKLLVSSHSIRLTTPTLNPPFQILHAELVTDSQIKANQKLITRKLQQ